MTSIWKPFFNIVCTSPTTGKDEGLFASVVSTGNQPLPVSSRLQTGLGSEAKGTTSPLVSAGDPAAVSTACVAPKPAVAPTEVDGSGSSASTAVVLGTEEMVTQAATPSTSPSGTTRLVLNPAASPESTPQDTPSSDSGIVSNVDSARVNALFCCCRSNFLIVFSVYLLYKGKQLWCTVLQFILGIHACPQQL